MPILAEPEERPGCLPGLKDEPLLPSIKPQLNPDKNHNLVSEHRAREQPPGKPLRATHSDNFGNYDNSRHHHHMNPHIPHSSAPGSVSSTPFKLPTIDRSKSNSVASLTSRNKFGQKKSRGRSRDHKLRRSPSCPDVYASWQDGDDDVIPDTPETCTSRLSSTMTPGDPQPRAFVRPYFSSRDDSTNVKLPGIFQHRNSINSSFTLTSSTVNSSACTSRDNSPFSFKRDAGFLANMKGSPDGANSNLSNHRDDNGNDHDNSFQRSGTQSSALLLPIASGNHEGGKVKGKRKRKKANEFMNLKDGNSEAEKLLREKLGAIECREINGSSPRHEREKTDQSDTAFIDSVRDSNETAAYANEAYEHETYANESNNKQDNISVSSKTSIYQSTPARIKTEKKIASVRA